jgi:cobalt/nickel transport system permease protein
MHISEGVLSGTVLVSGAVLTAAGTAVGLKKLDYERIPQVALLSAVFFMASLVHVPIGPGNVHLVLNGLLGLFLGWVSFPAVLIAILLQAMLFQFGGFTSLGVNAVNMALPAVVCFYLFGAGIRSKNPRISGAMSFLCGFMAVFLGAVMTALSLMLTGEAFFIVSKLLVVAHLPVMVIEGIIAAACVRFLRRVKPDMLEVVYAR